MKKLLSVLLIGLLLLTACTPKDETAGTATDSDLVINTDSDLTVKGESEIAAAPDGESDFKYPDAIETAPPEYYEDLEAEQNTVQDETVSHDTPVSNEGATEPGYEGDATTGSSEPKNEETKTPNPEDVETPSVEIVQSDADMTTF